VTGTLLGGKLPSLPECGVRQAAELAELKTLKKIESVLVNNHEPENARRQLPIFGI
jgi:hypothetical protein